jgi:hypothetical protein
MVIKGPSHQCLRAGKGREEGTGLGSPLTALRDVRFGSSAVGVQAP